ncbi:dTDP-4-dehydrorhamnose reductase family protein [Cohnella suwonensis]|uniref:dTDP-4-dehydrorhamnose reductase n=1 Tax=Cohnella suwonensis TaxID=696072 RepID=A0ABW0LSF7_9BACL
MGGRGMAGHLIVDYFSQTNAHEVWSTVRGRLDNLRTLPLDVTDELGLSAVLHRIRPDLVINAAGLLNDHAGRNIRDAIHVNSLLPHKLAQYGERLGFRLIHISTDCVFSGNRGDYNETDATCGTTVYARTKQLGEVKDDSNLTIRTSIIGPELKMDGIGLFHWFIGQRGTVKGYKQVIWNGVTTLQLAKAIDWTLGHPVTGLAHLASPNKIAKFELLQHMKTVFGKDGINIEPDDGYRSDKSLVNTRPDFAVDVPDYPDMLAELKSWMETCREARYGHYVI